jgi:TonB family protein
MQSTRESSMIRRALLVAVLSSLNITTALAEDPPGYYEGERILHDETLEDGTRVLKVSRGGEPVEIIVPADQEGVRGGEKAPMPTTAAGDRVASIRKAGVLRYPPEAIRQHVNGVVTLSVVVGVDGKPVDIVLAKSSGHSALDDAAHQSVRQWLFHPALNAGVPVEASIEVPVTFELALQN